MLWAITLPHCRITTRSPPSVDEQRPVPPDQYSIPAHFALRNLEQLDHILTENRDKQAPAGAMTEQLHGLRRGLADVIDGANGEAPWVSGQWN